MSPDGRWLLCSSTQTGSREVFLESLPEAMGGPRGRRQKAGLDSADGKMMSGALASAAGNFKLGVPKPLFQTRLEFDLLPRQYDVSADGKRFLLAQPLEESATVPITVIVQWPTLLKK
jgi:hypothetical protein